MEDNMHRYNFEDPKPLNIPEKLARFAKREAKRIFKMIESWKIKFEYIKKTVNQPYIQELVHASDVKKFIGYSLSLMFLIGLFVEWNFSNEVYESQTSVAFLFFLGLVLSGLFCSASFGTAIREFKTYSTQKPQEKQYYEITYETENSKKWYWYIFHPINGLIVFILIEFIVYHLSNQRVMWQQSIGVNSNNDVWLPVIWFALEVLFGIGFHYTGERLYVTKKYSSYEKELGQEEDQIEQKIHKCVDSWSEYNSQMDIVECEALEQGLEVPEREEPNEYLKVLLDLENGNGFFTNNPSSFPNIFNDVNRYPRWIEK